MNSLCTGHHVNIPYTEHHAMSIVQAPDFMLMGPCTGHRINSSCDGHHVNSPCTEHHALPIVQAPDFMLIGPCTGHHVNRLMCCTSF